MNPRNWRFFLQIATCIMFSEFCNSGALPAQGFQEWTASKVAEKMAFERQKLRSGKVHGDGWLTEKERRLAPGAEWDQPKYDEAIQMQAAFDYVQNLLFFDYRGDCYNQSKPTRTLYFRQPKYTAFLMIDDRRGMDNLMLREPSADHPGTGSVCHQMPDFRIAGLGNLTKYGRLKDCFDRLENGGWGGALLPVALENGVLTMLTEDKDRRYRFKIDVEHGFTLIERADEWNPRRDDWRIRGSAPGEFETLGVTQITWSSIGDVYYPVSILSDAYGPFPEKGKIEADIQKIDLRILWRKQNWKFDWSEVNQRLDPKSFDYRTVKYDRATTVFGIDNISFERLGVEPVELPQTAKRSGRWIWLLGMLTIIVITGFLGWRRKTNT